MRVEAIKQATPRQAGGFTRQDSPSEQPEQKVESRALVATAPAPVAETPARPRQAAFLAHLIATSQLAPQTRERRRAEPAEAIAAYRAAGRLTPA